MSTWRYIVPGALLVGFIGYTLFTVGHPNPTAVSHKQHHTEADASAKHPSTRLPKPPSSHAPLIKREEWIMHWQPQWVQNDWRNSGRPPLRWGSSIGPGGMWGYFFTQNPGAGQSTNITLPNYPPVRVMRNNPPSWYGMPLKP